MDDWLVSIEKNGKVVELYFSKGLIDLDTIRALHKGCDVNAVRIMTRDKSVCEEKCQNKKDKNRKWQIRSVTCIETGQTWNSAADCSKSIGVPRSNVYKAIQRGITAGGFHFKYSD